MQVTLDRNNTRDAMQLRRFARDSGWKATNPVAIATRFAATFGYVCYWRANDHMTEFSLESGRVRTKTHKPYNWKF